MTPSLLSTLNLAQLGILVCAIFLLAYLFLIAWRFHLGLQRRQQAAAQLNSALKFANPSWEHFGQWASECELKAADPKLVPSEARSLRDQATRYREAQYAAIEESGMK